MLSSPDGRPKKKRLKGRLAAMVPPDEHPFDPVDRAGGKTFKGSRPFGPWERSGPLLVPLGRNSTESGAVAVRLRAGVLSIYSDTGTHRARASRTPPATSWFLATQGYA